MLDYHLARAQRVGAGVWAARCACGWEGPRRDGSTARRAADDEGAT